MTTKPAQRLTLDDVRNVFPNVRIAPEDDDLPLAMKRLPRKCMICGFIYNGWPESEYCSNKCAGIGHRQHKNPSKERIKSLREQCRPIPLTNEDTINETQPRNAQQKDSAACP